MRCGRRLPPRNLIPRMAVPRMSQLRQGTTVNIVLKADQPTGQLTTGTIADFLTRGDHARGIKVRLSDGKIGRVQSLASSIQSSAQATSTEDIPFQTRRSGTAAGHGLQQDYRTEEQPEEDASLLDYIKLKPKKKSKGKRKEAERSVEAEQSQGRPESEAASLQLQI